MKDLQQFIKKNVGNIIFLILFLVVMFVPSVKATLIQGLMQVGIMKPNVDQELVIGHSNDSLRNDLPAVELTAPDYFQVYLPQQKGKVVFINFWATWCPPCLAEMPSLNKLYNQFKDRKDLVFLFVDADANFDKSTAYLNKKQYNLPVYKANQNFPSQLYDGSLPTTLVFNKSGKLVYKGIGAANYADKKFVQFMHKLLQE